MAKVEQKSKPFDPAEVRMEGHEVAPRVLVRVAPCLFIPSDYAIFTTPPLTATGCQSVRLSYHKRYHNPVSLPVPLSVLDCR